MDKKKREKDFVVEYEYVPSKNSKIRLQRGFAIILEKIINLEEINKNHYEHETNSLLH